MTAQTLLQEVRQHGVTLTVVAGKLRYRAPKRILTVYRQVLQQHKAEIITLLQQETPTVWTRSEEGAALIAPYLPLIQAAHRVELPARTVIMAGQKYDISDYICRISAGIWYGQTLDHPLLPLWLENLRRLEEWRNALNV